MLVLVSEIWSSAEFIVVPRKPEKENVCASFLNIFQIKTLDNMCFSNRLFLQINICILLKVQRTYNVNWAFFYKVVFRMLYVGSAIHNNILTPLSPAKINFLVSIWENC